jgi:hypothetical protein
MDLEIRSIQLKAVEVLNMNEIVKGGYIWSLRHYRQGPALCIVAFSHSGKSSPPLAWYSQSLELHSLTSSILRPSQDPALGLAK